MNIRDIREIMGLTQAQVADELGVPRQEVIDCEENGETYLLLQYISAFPINPGILKIRPRPENGSAPGGRSTVFLRRRRRPRWRSRPSPCWSLSPASEIRFPAAGARNLSAGSGSTGNG